MAPLGRPRTQNTTTAAHCADVSHIPQPGGERAPVQRKVVDACSPKRWSVIIALTMVMSIAMPWILVVRVTSIMVMIMNMILKGHNE